MYPSTPTEAALTALAQGAGAHALNGFFALLALMLTFELLTWRVRPAPSPHRANGARPSDRWVLVLALALIATAVLGFAMLAYEVRLGDTFVRVDQAFLEAVRGGTSARTVQDFAWITLLGDGRTLALLCIAGVIALLARGERLLGFGLVAAMGGNGLLNAVLKRVFERMRPPHELGLPVAHGWSFPSGHSSGAVVAYGMLAYVLLRTLPSRWHLPVVLSATALAFSVGCSRIFIEVHYASDVLAAFASGTAWLTACIVGIEIVRHRTGPTPNTTPVLNATAFPIARPARSPSTPAQHRPASAAAPSRT
jgi:undecaprenyl-diphosphatase